MFYIYEIKLKKSNRKYIGYSKNVEGRWIEHKRDLRNNKHHSQYLQRAWNKYGEEDFIFTIVEKYLSIEEATEREKYLIENNKGGFNIASGGTGGNTRAKMTKQQQQAYSKKLSEAQTRRYSNPAERQKINVFANLSQEQREVRLKVWSEAKKGPKNSNFKHSQQVQQIDKKTGEVIRVWENAWEASQEGYNSEYIVKCCKKIKSYNTHKGYIWEWKIN